MSLGNALWQAVLGEIEVSISRASFATWFKNTALLENQDGQLTVGVPNIFTKRQLEDKYHPLLCEVLEKNGIKSKKIVFKIHEAPKVKTAVPSADWSVRPSSSATGQTITNLNLNSKYTFDNFVVGSSNELAYAAAQAIAREPGVKYNPLFLYGGVGLGKTHLIQAIGNEISHRNPDSRIEYITSEQFASQFIASILRKKTFANRYRDVDVLIVDDMQFIAGKQKTEEEFFHTFNALHQANKQIIISSDKPPGAIATLEERLRSRFEWGMTADIQPPDFETRVAIIQTKASQHGITIPSEVCEYLATNIQSNVRELEGALTKLLANCDMLGVVPSLEVVTHAIGPIGGRSHRLTSKIIIDKTARHFNLSVDELVGPKRDRNIVEPRQIAMYLMRAELHLSFPAIAKQVGRKDHTTAIHSVGKIEEAITRDNGLRQAVYEIKEKLYV